MGLLSLKDTMCEVAKNINKKYITQLHSKSHMTVLSCKTELPSFFDIQKCVTVSRVTEIFSNLIAFNVDYSCEIDGLKLKSIYFNKCIIFSNFCINCIKTLLFIS